MISPVEAAESRLVAGRLDQAERFLAENSLEDLAVLGDCHARAHGRLSATISTASRSIPTKRAMLSICRLITLKVI